MSYIYISGVIGQDTTLLDVIRQYKSLKSPSEVTVKIDSIGGYVDQGKAIFNYLRNLGIPVTTHATRAYSIAAHIFMAGDRRVVESGPDRVMIHMPWAEMAGRADDFEAISKELKSEEKEFIKFYSAYLSTDEATIANLLQSEAMLSSDEALGLGLATEISSEMKAVAFFNSPKNEPLNKFNIMNKAESLLKALQGFLTPSEDSAPEIKALMIQDANGIELNFPDLADDAIPEVGARVEAEDGEYIMPDGSTFVVSGGALTEIRPAEEEQPAEESVAEEGQKTDIEQMLRDLFGEAKEEARAQAKSEFSPQIEELKNEILALRKIIGTKDIESEAKQAIKNSNLFI